MCISFILKFRITLINGTNRSLNHTPQFTNAEPWDVVPDIQVIIETDCCFVCIQRLPVAANAKIENKMGLVSSTMLQTDQFKNQLHYIIRTMKERRFTAKTQKKIDSLLSNTFRSFTNIKHQNETDQLNAETIPQCRTKHGLAVSVSPESLKDDIIAHLLHQGSPASVNLSTLFNNWIEGKWKDLRMRISSRLNKLKYLQPSLIGESFGVTEKQILLQWKKNVLLQGFQLLWNHVFKSWKFVNVQQLQNFYNTFRLIITQISYNLFHSSLNKLAKDHFPIQHKLYNYTAVTIITSDPQWKDIAQNVIKAQYYKQAVSFSQNYDLRELNARPQMIDINSLQPVFGRTALGIQKLLESYTREDIISSLKEYRAGLLKQIQANIQKWRKQNHVKKSITVQKQDVLSCIIYTLVRHKLDNIILALKYITFLYGKEIDSVLGACQVDCYRVDLQVAYEYLSQPVLHLSISDFGNDDKTN